MGKIFLEVSGIGKYATAEGLSLIDFLSLFHCIFMIYPRTANGMSWCSLHLWETRESGDERKEQKQENGVIDLIWILLSAVRVMMMM